MSANRWFAGLVGNTRNCAVTGFKLGAGWHALLTAIRLFLRFGNDSAARFSPREPHESRGSRTVLEEPRGENPRGYLTRLRSATWQFVARAQHGCVPTATQHVPPI